MIVIPYFTINLRSDMCLCLGRIHIQHWLLLKEIHEEINHKFKVSRINDLFHYNTSRKRKLHPICRSVAFIERNKTGSQN